MGVDESASGRPSPELAAAYALCADGAWHDYEEVIAVMVARIPPGKAARTAEAARVQRARQNARERGEELPAGYVPLRHQPMSQEQMVAMGARAIARKALVGSRLIIDPPGRPAAGQTRRVRDPQAAPASGKKSSRTGRR